MKTLMKDYRKQWDFIDVRDQAIKNGAAPAEAVKWARDWVYKQHKTLKAYRKEGGFY